jgi:predicted peroxiredoxin
MLSKTTNLLKTQVIQKYLHGLSMNDIVRETLLSKGTVNNIIQDWRSNIDGTNIEEIRAFTSEVRKSGVTIVECAQGFRTVQLLKKFDINDEFDSSSENVEDEYEYEDLDPDVDKSSSITNHNPSTQHTNEVTNPYVNGN